MHNCASQDRAELRWPGLGRIMVVYGCRELIVRLGDAVTDVSDVQLGGTQANRAERFNTCGFEVAAYAVDGILTNPAQNFTETVRDLATGAYPVRRNEDWRTLPDHDRYVIGLRSDHGRKTGFWNLVGKP